MTGLLLCNLGTPDGPTPRAVRRYLREFLSDPRVLDMNPVGRWLLLNLIILPLRPRKSAEAYRKIWTERGSPLLLHGEDLVAAVGERLGPGFVVALGMRYGRPSIATALERLRKDGARRIVALPLYPQYASSTTGSTLEALARASGRLGVAPPPALVPAFYDDPRFIDACAAVGRPILDAEQPEHVLMSFHGLPERHVRKGDPSGRHCLVEPGCCERISESNRDCYRAQCFATARALAARLGRGAGTWSVGFQSRLGRTPWIAPYTDHRIAELAAGGTKRLVVFCPAFVADCLETLEEIGIRGQAQFRAAGGERLTLVPSLNATPAWVDAVASLARQHEPGADERRR